MNLKMLKIRSNVFETNSSSTHSFIVSDHKNYEIKPFVEPSWETEFGWSFEEWSAPEEKLAYVIRCLVYGYKWIDKKVERDSWNDSDFILNETIVTILKPFKERCNYLGFDFPYPSTVDLESGYIDHEDWYKEEIRDLILEDSDLLNFIFNPDCYIQGGNDNC